MRLLKPMSFSALPTFVSLYWLMAHGSGDPLKDNTHPPLLPAFSSVNQLQESWVCVRIASVMHNSSLQEFYLLKHGAVRSNLGFTAASWRCITEEFAPCKRAIGFQINFPIDISID